MTEFLENENTTVNENETINEESGLTENLIQESGFITPEMHGAVGDGVEDDTAAIQACFNEGIQLGKSIAFTSGKIYKIKQSINISGFGGSYKEKLVLGNAATILVDFNGFAFDVIREFGGNSYNSTFKNLNVKANITGIGSGFNIHNYQLLDFEDCTFENLKYGIYNKDICYQSIVKCQFVGCKMGMVFDVSDTEGKRETNNINIDKCRLTTSLKENMYIYDGDTYVDEEGNTLLKAIKFIETEVEENKIVLIPETETAPLGMAGIYIKGYPHGFRITNNCIELYQYGICGCGDLSAVSQSELFISNNYFELNKYHIYLSGVEFENVNRVINGVEINEEFAPRWLHSKRFMSANITGNYYCGARTTDNDGIDCGTDGKIVLGKGENRLKENKWYTKDCIEVDNTQKNEIYDSVIVYTDDDMFINVLGSIKTKTIIHTKSDCVICKPNGANKLVRILRKSPYFVNGVGKLQHIENTDMTIPEYDGSFNPDESYKYPDKTVIKINRTNYTCNVFSKNNGDSRYYSDDNIPAYAKISEIFKSTNFDNRYFVDKTSGMLIDYATRSYCGTIYGTRITNNPAYGYKAPTEAVLYPVQNEIYCKIKDKIDASGNVTGQVVDKYYLYDENGWVQCKFVITDNF